MGVRPIIFSTPMVRAILDGNKTVTRRVMKPQPIEEPSGNLYFNGNVYWRRHLESFVFQYAPYRVGDTLWVRETWTEINGGVVHKANPDALEFFEATHIAAKWRPSIHMPKAAARIFLRVTDVHVERLQDITGAGIVCEGLLSGSRREFRFLRDKLFDGLYKPAEAAKYCWIANPWVWVISFERCGKPEAWDRPRSLAEEMGFATVTFTGLLQ